MTEPIRRADLRRTYTVENDRADAWRQDVIAGAARLSDLGVIAGTRPSGKGLVTFSLVPVLLVRRADWAAVTVGSNIDTLERRLEQYGGKHLCETSRARVRWRAASGDDDFWVRVDVKVSEGLWTGEFAVAGEVTPLRDALWTITVSPLLAFCSIENYPSVFDGLSPGADGLLPWNDYLTATGRLFTIATRPSEAVARAIRDAGWPIEPVPDGGRGWMFMRPEPDPESEEDR